MTTVPTNGISSDESGSASSVVGSAGGRVPQSRRGCQEVVVRDHRNLGDHLTYRRSRPANGVERDYLRIEVVAMADDPWGGVADELIDAARRGADEVFAQLASAAVAAGRVAALAAAIDERKAGGVPLVVEVLRADLATRDQTISFHRLRTLDQRVQAADLPAEYRSWTSVILAEWGLWRGDFSTFGYAHSAVGRTLPAPGLSSLVEGRRLRIIALMLTVAEPNAEATASTTARARALLTSAEAVEELALTDVMLGYGRLSICDDPSSESVAVIRRGVAELERLGSDRLGVGLAFLAWGGYMSGDFATAATALDRWSTVVTSGPTLPPLADEGVALLQALAQMVIEGPNTQVMGELRLRFDRLRSSWVPAWMLAPVANDLLDAGQVDFAVDVMAAIGPEDPFVLAADMVLREVDIRIRILRDGDHSAIADLWKLYGEYERTGRFRRAAASAVRCAWTCAAAGFDDDAARLNRWGLALLPPDRDRTAWERAYIAGGDPARRWASTRRGALRVLVPRPTLTRDGETIELDGEAAVLMAVLAATKGPLPVADVAAVLRPGVDSADAPHVVSDVVSALRERFDLLPGELIRAGDVNVELDDRGWSVDVREFWDLTAGGDERRARALDLYNSDLIAEERNGGALVESRRDQLRRHWLDALRSLVAAGQISPADAVARFRRAAPDDVVPSFG